MMQGQQFPGVEWAAYPGVTNAVKSALGSSSGDPGDPGALCWTSPAPLSGVVDAICSLTS